MHPISDLFIIGGGINGVGIAADAAGRGLTVTLCEQDDLGQHTSSSSSKLIHGGLRYLEHYEFRLVREALQEREILLHKAPHLVHPIQFVMPHNPHLRPCWLIRLGLLFYDFLAKRQRLPRSRKVNLRHDPVGVPLKTTHTQGFIYSDCVVDDTRLVIVNAMAARDKGALILPRHQVMQAKRLKECWEITVKTNKQEELFYARVLINAAGPWVNILRQHLDLPTQQQVRLVKGSHIVVSKLYLGKQAYLLQHTDKRVIFVLPFQNDYSLIGTTDVAYVGNPADAIISDAEIDYLCTATQRYFNHALKPSDIISAYAGVRPLQQDDTANLARVTRDYRFELDAENQMPPLLTVFGGKITTYRKLAEGALNALRGYFPTLPAPWTATAPLPGGDLPQHDFNAFVQSLQRDYPKLPTTLLSRYAKLYGTKAYQMLQQVNDIADLDQHFGHGLYAKEVDYLIQYEWAQTTQDILWRRTKLGLKFSPEQVKALHHAILTNLAVKNAKKPIF